MIRTPAVSRSGRVRVGLRALAGFFVAVVLAGAMAAWLYASESGLRALAGAARVFSGGAIHAEGASGSLRGPLGFAALRLDFAKAHVELKGVALEWRAPALAAGKLEIARLRADSVDVRLDDAPGSSSAPALPESLRPPFTFELTTVEVGALTVRRATQANATESSPLFALADGKLSASFDGERFAVRELAADLPQGRAEARGELGAARPFALTLDAALTAKDKYAVAGV
ncbi:MAG: hypothetical protein LBR05_09560, partial [Azoarcus sp.]|nr:hypothetical protein [Azoarcus sp.]